MRNNASSYAPRETRAIEQEREFRYRLTEARLERQARAVAAMIASGYDAVQLYRTEKAKRIERGAPVLTPIDDYRGAR